MLIYTIHCMFWYKFKVFYCAVPCALFRLWKWMWMFLVSYVTALTLQPSTKQLV
jgi:hypothetical protein